MAIHPYEEETPYREGPDISHPVKRLRWATRRATGHKGRTKRQSIMDRLHKRTSSSGTNRHSGSHRSNGPQDEQDSQDESDQDTVQRTLYFNRPLPPNARDEQGHPIQHFARNKIRTSKYTPLSFVPKNLYFQFHNIANMYFLFIIILSIFPVFGASNPGLIAVPLIVILLVTAIKDGIEDWRRTVLDNELNNSPVHRLVGWNNVNTAEDKVSLWRRFKKLNTRAILRMWTKMKGWGHRKQSKGKGYAQRALDEARPSVETTRPSIYTERTSLDRKRSRGESNAFPMTDVPSPMIEHEEQLPKDVQVKGAAVWTRRASNPDVIVSDSAESAMGNRRHKFYGSLIDSMKPTPGKAHFKKDYWKSVQVGDFVRLYNEEQVPADVVVLSTSDEDGSCYVETKNLDGETNLKVRSALRCGRSLRHARDCEKADFMIESEGPHANLYAYSGVARWMQRDPQDPEGSGSPMAEPISINNLLLRGSSVRNTEWVLGVVLFTGGETKIMLNSGLTPRKRARISRDLNWNVIYNFVILFFMCLVSGIVEGVTWAQGHNSSAYFEFGSYGTPAADGVLTFWSALILFQNLVPISLYISLEIIRTLQAFFIYSDTLMYYDKIDYPCTPKSWNISDDLGQIEYIFSDKTGTLTQNVMEFKKATINGVPYGEAYTEAQAGMRKRQGVDVDEEVARARAQIARDRLKMLEDIRKMHDNPYLLDDNLTFVAPDFVSDLRGDSGEVQKRANEGFMLALALCHTVVTEKLPGDPPKLEFKAQSPDEATLVATARDCGFTVLGRSGDQLQVNVLGVNREYTLLNHLEFNSSRKRMSAIIRTPEGKIMLYCKGADSVIYSRLRKGEQSELRKITAEHLEMFAREGLRTLCVAQRELEEEEYREWNKAFDLAAAAVSEREEKIETVADAIERELILIGGTAIEDRLQDGVPDAIALLGQAGIKLWVLTGDKVETAINIGFSCNLLNNDMDLIVISIEEGGPRVAEQELDKHLSTFGLSGSDEELTAARKNHEPPPPTHAIVIDGESLKYALDESLQQKFLLLCKQCKAVLCCRVSPSQKAAVVAMVKNGLDVMTLSVGDGANDVAMIQEADVGIGIAGEEGRQAVMSSDFAIGQFRFLTRLVLVHGRWSYRRLAESILNFFYKNMVWTFALFWYQIYDSFDCEYLFDYTYILFYNLAFTSLPVILMGVLDQDVSDEVSLVVPQLYRRGIERKEWTQIRFWMYMLDGIYQSLICFFMTYLVFQPATFATDSGRNVNDAKRMGVYVANPTIVVVNTYILLNTYRWDWLMLLITAISTLLVFFWTGVYSTSTLGFTFYEAGAQVFGQLTFWTNTLLTVIVCLLPRFAIKAYQKIYSPYDVDVVREQVKLGRFADRKLIMSEKASSVSSSDVSRQKQNGNVNVSDDERPIYPPSLAQTGTTQNPSSQNGSDRTEYAGDRQSLERPMRPSLDRPRPSFERMRASMDRIRPSYQQSNDITTAAMLTRVESSNNPIPHMRQRDESKPS